MPCAMISGIWKSLSKCSSAVIQQKTRVRRQSASGMAAVATTERHVTKGLFLWTRTSGLRQVAGPGIGPAERLIPDTEDPVSVLDHIAEGMYGMTIVDPKGGWPNGKAHEVMLVQGEFYGTPNSHGLVRPDHVKMVDGTPDFVVFNGEVNRYGLNHPIPIKVGELVRIFFVNIGPNLFSDFHVVGAILNTVYRSGNPADALHDLQSFEVGPGNGAVFEFRVYHPGTYMFMDHAMGHAYKGAMGIFHAMP